MTIFKRLAVLFIAFILITPAFAGDHIDSPLNINDPDADLADVYAFVNPNDPDEFIMIVTWLPFASVDSMFSDAVLFTFHLVNGAGVDNSIQCTFSTPDASGDQTVTCDGPGSLDVSGPVEQTVDGGDMRVFAGIFDDPFFFDSPAFKETVATGAPQFTDPGFDAFAGFNVQAIVLGVNIDTIAQTPSGSPSSIQTLYLTTERNSGAGIGGGFSGAWYGPDNGGTGFTFEVLQPPPAAANAKVHYSENLWATWYFTLGDDLAWLTGLGPVSADGSTATVDMVLTTGGGSPDNFNPANVTRETVGTLTVTAADCNSGTIQFDSVDPRFPDVSHSITRLTQIKDLDCSFLVSGNIDREGRPGINTALVPTDAESDLYNITHDPAQWSQFKPTFVTSLDYIDGLDGTMGNALLGDSSALADVLLDDRLITDTSVPNCGAYLAVEAASVGGTTPTACGGRTLAADVIDVTLTVTVGPPVGDGVDANDKPFEDAFPFLPAPHF